MSNKINPERDNRTATVRIIIRIQYPAPYNDRLKGGGNKKRDVLKLKEIIKQQCVIVIERKVLKVKFD